MENIKIYNYKQIKETFKEKAPQASKAPWGPALGRQQGLVARRNERNPKVTVQ